MKVEELRIGNIVLARGAQSVVKSIDENHVGYSKSKKGEERVPIKLIQPIPLTEEWLVKFGFEKYTSHHYYFCVLQRGTIHVYLETNFSDVSVELGNSFGQSFGYPKIKHVHQLQNLYWCLCGKELTIKN